MFNLIMGSAGDWQSSRETIDPGRVFEYTDAYVSALFKRPAGITWDALLQFPCLFMQEGTKDELAYVGHINRIRPGNREIAIEFTLDHSVPPLRNSMIFERRADLNMPALFEFSRNHWAVKDVDLYRFLYMNALAPQRQRPQVFQIPERESVDGNLVSAMMPFAVNFAPVYHTIQQAAKEAGMRCNRADDIWEAPSIIQDVVSLIDRSRIVICDCSGRNPNVFYEAGIAHTLGREVILITQNEHDIPFDLRHIRFIHYLNNQQGRTDLGQHLLSRMRTVLQQ